MRTRIGNGSRSRSKTYHNIVTERTTKNATLPRQTDLNKFSSKKITNVKVVIKQNGTPFSLDLPLVKNKKDVIDSVWVEHDDNPP